MRRKYVNRSCADSEGRFVTVHPSRRRNGPNILLVESLNSLAARTSTKKDDLTYQNLNLISHTQYEYGIDDSLVLGPWRRRSYLPERVLIGWVVAKTDGMSARD